MRYQLLIWEDEATALPPAECDQWVEDNQDTLRQCARLRPSADTTTVRVRDGELLISDGPFPETKEQIGGFHLIECENLDDAIELARKHPAARSGAIEVRPIWEQ
ncbi:MAG: transcription initiation protein [Saccharothrix sp.]|nr:transcription initiation protein [Saccharothrix sp.]